MKAVIERKSGTKNWTVCFYLDKNIIDTDGSEIRGFYIVIFKPGKVTDNIVFNITGMAEKEISMVLVKQYGAKLKYNSVEDYHYPAWKTQEEGNKALEFLENLCVAANLGGFA